MFLTNLFEAAASQVVVVYPGRFQPFHKGHAAVYNHLCEKYGKENVYIATSNKVDPPRSPFNFQEKLAMMKLTGIDPSRVIEDAQPYRVEKFVAQFPADSTALIFAISEKDMAEDPRFQFKPKKDGSPSYFQKFPGFDKALPLSKHGYITTVPTFNFTVLGKPANSATEIRAQFANADETTQKKIVTDLFGNFDETVYRIMIAKLRPTPTNETKDSMPRIKTRTSKDGKKTYVVLNRKGVTVDQFDDKEIAKSYLYSNWIKLDEDQGDKDWWNKVREEANNRTKRNPPPVAPKPPPQEKIPEDKLTEGLDHLINIFKKGNDQFMLWQNADYDYTLTYTQGPHGEFPTKHHFVDTSLEDVIKKLTTAGYQRMRTFTEGREEDAIDEHRKMYFDLKDAWKTAIEKFWPEASPNGPSETYFYSPGGELVAVWNSNTDYGRGWVKKPIVEDVEKTTESSEIPEEVNSFRQKVKQAGLAFENGSKKQFARHLQHARESLLLLHDSDIPKLGKYYDEYKELRHIFAKDLFPAVVVAEGVEENPVASTEENDLLDPDPKVRALASAVIKMEQEVAALTNEPQEEAEEFNIREIADTVIEMHTQAREGNMLEVTQCLHKLQPYQEHLKEDIDKALRVAKRNVV